MTHKHILLTFLLPSLFVFTITSPAQQPNAQPAQKPNLWEKEVAKAAGTIAVSETISLINAGKEYMGIIAPDKQAQINLFNKQTELADRQIAGCDKQDKLNDQQEIINDKTAILTDKQIEHTDGQIKDNEIERDLKTITFIKESLVLLDPNDPVAKSTKSRAKQLLIKRTEHLAEAQEEKKPEETKKPEDDKPKQDSFFTSLATYCGLGAVAAGAAADAIAEYSFKYVTDLDCFKDTFIGKHSLGINRALVAVTLTALTYKAYYLYKAYQAERNFKEEDIFNDDLD